MEFEFKEGEILFKRELSDLDKFVIDFVDVLNQNNIKYVIISGYVSILFGRSRTTEDIDLFIEKITIEKFKRLIKDFESKGMWIINELNAENAYKMVEDNLGIRVAERGKAIPNFEIKFPKKDLDNLSLQKPLKVIVNGKNILISPLEIQIAYKLYLGSDKDLEDAVYIYEIFKQNLNKTLLNNVLNELDVKRKADKYGIG